MKKDVMRRVTILATTGGARCIRANRLSFYPNIRVELPPGFRNRKASSYGTAGALARPSSGNCNANSEA